MQVDGNTVITLSLSLDKTNAVLASLSQQPYQQVAGLIADIQQQASMQLQPKPPVAEASE